MGGGAVFLAIPQWPMQPWDLLWEGPGVSHACMYVCRDTQTIVMFSNCIHRGGESCYAPYTNTLPKLLFLTASEHHHCMRRVIWALCPCLQAISMTGIPASSQSAWNMICCPMRHHRCSFEITMNLPKTNSHCCTQTKCFSLWQRYALNLPGQYNRSYRFCYRPSHPSCIDLGI